MADKVKDELNKGLKNSEVLSHEEVREGVHELEIDVRQGRPAKELAFLTGKNGEPSPLRYHEGGRVITRDFTRRVKSRVITRPPSWYLSGLRSPSLPDKKAGSFSSFAGCPWRTSISNS